jgi:hypothetical protein
MVGSAFKQCSIVCIIVSVCGGGVRFGFAPFGANERHLKTGLAEYGKRVAYLAAVPAGFFASLAHSGVVGDDDGYFFCRFHGDSSWPQKLEVIAKSQAVGESTVVNLAVSVVGTFKQKLVFDIECNERVWCDIGFQAEFRAGDEGLLDVVSIQI